MKVKIVIKVQMHCEKCRNKALKTAAEIKGVTSVSLDGDDKDRVVVIGDNVNTICLANRLQKKFQCVTILIVEEVKPPKPPTPTPTPKPPPPPTPPPPPPPQCKCCEGKCKHCTKCQCPKCQCKCVIICIKCQSSKCDGKCGCSKCKSPHCGGQCINICFNCQSPKCSGQCSIPCYNFQCPPWCTCPRCYIPYCPPLCTYRICYESNPDSCTIM